MATLKKDLNITGKTLMAGQACSVSLFPSESGEIKFFVQGCENSVIADAFNVASTDNCVALANQNCKVMLVEHFMAACAFAGIDSLDVCLSFFEMPILDGSALPWFELFNEAGVSETQENSIEIKEPICYSNKKSSIAILPAEEFKITYCINFNHPDLNNRWVDFSFDMDKKQILEARTFGYLKDLEKFQKMGIALGAGIENTVGLTDNGYTTELRSEYEPIKHKILDIIGDLNLMPFNPLDLKAHIIAKEAGHKSHVEMAKKLKQYLCQIRHCERSEAIQEM